jgi:antitoxin HigA-1
VVVHRRSVAGGIANTSGLKRRPTHPGEMLSEDFLVDYDLTVTGPAEALGVSRESINELLRERRAVSPEMALRLARLFGNITMGWRLTLECFLRCRSSQSPSNAAT